MEASTQHSVWLQKFLKVVMWSLVMMIQLQINMLEVFDYYWKQLESQPNYDIFWEVCARAQYEDGKLVGDKLPHPYFNSDYNEVNFKLKKGAKWMDVVR